MYEHRREPVLPRLAFLLRLAQHVLASGALVGGSLLLGTVGYHELARFSWVDSLLNASMLLGGMGPVGELPGTTAKLFAAAFALYSGLVFIVAMGLVLAPILHRVFHRLHVEGDEEPSGPAERTGRRAGSRPTGGAPHGGRTDEHASTD